MAKIKEPSRKAPWPPREKEDYLDRYPTPYRLGKASGESFASIAKAHGLNALDLIAYNFLTTDEGEINWYLINYIGCAEPKPSQAYVSFAGVTPTVLKPDAGQIFIPTFGNRDRDYWSRWGLQIVDDYNAAPVKKPGGPCSVVSHNRVRDAGKKIGVVIPDMTQGVDLNYLWQNRTDSKSWLKLPAEHRGKGAVGALVNEGYGEYIEKAGIWAGELAPGAVVQTWKTERQYEQCRDGTLPAGPSDRGHSFIFLNYVRGGGMIIGMAVADNHTYTFKVVRQSEWSYWVATNLNF